jgi:hypothetical protein
VLNLQHTTIDWGDGTWSYWWWGSATANGSVELKNGVLTVTGSHTYAEDGRHTVRVWVNDHEAYEFHDDGTYGYDWKQGKRVITVAEAAPLPVNITASISTALTAEPIPEATPLNPRDQRHRRQPQRAGRLPTPQRHQV